VFSDSHWVWLGVAWLLVALAAGVIGWGLFWDRSRGRARCPKCWYDMTPVDGGKPSLTCPECGRTAQRHSQLHKTRRRLGFAWIAAIALLGAQLLWSIDRIKQEGWPGAVPSAVLAATVSGPDPDASERHSGRFLDLRRILDERHGRGDVNGLDAWVWRTKLWVVFRCAGQIGATDLPPSDPRRALLVHDARPVVGVDWEVLAASGCALFPDGTRRYQMPMPDRKHELRDLVTANVASEDWIDNGGDAASIEVLDGRVVIAAPARHQAGVAELLTLLRSATSDHPSMGAPDEKAGTRSGAFAGSVPAVYDVEDIRRRDPDKPDGEARKELENIVTGVVHTEDWVGNGGDQASLMWWRWKMVVRAAPATHAEVQGLLAKMRAAGGDLRRLEESSAP
jgi:hypothetical protein